jgi:outer membrane protein TolC
LAEAQSPNIEVARSNVVRANGQRYQVRSQFFPKLNATDGYNKTLE